MTDDRHNLEQSLHALRLHHALLKEELNRVSRAINRRARKLKRMEKEQGK